MDFDKLKGRDTIHLRTQTMTEDEMPDWLMPGAWHVEAAQAAQPPPRSGLTQNDLTKLGNKT